MPTTKRKTYLAFIVLFLQTSLFAQDTSALSIKCNIHVEANLNAGNAAFSNGNGFSVTLYKRLNDRGRFLFNAAYSQWKNKDNIAGDGAIANLRIGYKYSLLKDLYSHVALGWSFANKAFSNKTGAAAQIGAGCFIHVTRHSAIDICTNLNYTNLNRTDISWVSFGLGYWVQLNTNKMRKVFLSK